MLDINAKLVIIHVYHAKVQQIIVLHVDIQLFFIIINA